MALHVSNGLKSNNSKNKFDGRSLTASLVYMNDGIRVCTEACACCWDKPIPKEYEEKAVYLGKRASTGHTSVFEHSNIIILVNIPKDISGNALDDILDAICESKYLIAHIAHGSEQNYIIIGGSYRGFIELFKRVDIVSDARANIVLNAIAKVLYQNVNSKVFAELINAGILAEESFINVEPDPVSKFFNPMPSKPYYEDDKIKIVSVDNPEIIHSNIEEITGEKNLLDDWQISTLASLTILFKDMSRTATHQLVRHRNGITQESQRYVDYSTAAFADPTSFKPDKYDFDRIYEFKFGGHKFNMTSMEIGEAICGIYHYMLDQGMMKEDARAFLPGNVKCRKLYMTFTLCTYMKFLELRCHPAAQAEIREFACTCRDATMSILEKFKDKQASAVDEVIGVTDEVITNKIIASTPELSDKEEEKE